MSNPFNKLIHYYMNDMKFRNKLLLSHILVVLVPTVITVFFFYQQYYKMLVDSSVASEQALVLQGGATLEARMSQIESTVNAIVNNQTTQKLFAQTFEEAAQSSEEGEELKDYYQMIYSLIDRELITDIRIYYDREAFDELKYANVGGKPIFKSIDNISSSYWYGIFSVTDEHTLFCPEVYLSHSEIRDNGELAYIQRIPYEGEMRNAGAYVAVYFSKKVIAKDLKSNIAIANGANYIVNERSVLVGASDNALAGVYFMTLPEIRNEIGAEETFVTDPRVGGNLYIGYQKLSSSDWYLVSVMPVEAVKKQGQNIAMRYLMLCAAVLVMGILFARLVALSIEKRLDMVVQPMRRVRSGKLEMIPEKQITEDEIGDVMESYNYMIQELEGLLEEKEKTAKEMRLVEFKALQAQINPHFLYNSLDMISWMTQTGKKEEATRAVRALSKFYKLTLSRKNETGTLETELEHVEQYVELQNMRFDQAIELLIDVPQEMLEYKMPRLIFQPIIENAVLHGIMAKEEKTGTIVITGWTEERDVLFLISDDGVGISEEQKKSILSGEKHEGTGTNIGIYNTHRRLQLLYGERYGLTYDGSVGVGTEVTIRIPLQEEVSDEETT